jgi:DNA polymerase III, alpha subunit
MAFVPLHNHSDYSLLDGASQLPQMVERAKALGMPALALTDHGVMYGAVELLKLCKGAGIKPIIGNEMYVINGSIDDPQPKRSGDITWLCWPRMPSVIGISSSSPASVTCAACVVGGSSLAPASTSTFSSNTARA